MTLVNDLIEYQNKKTHVVVNGIEADRVKDKKSGDYKGGTTISGVYTDFIEVRVHNVKAESKTDKLIESVEIIKIPLTAINSISEGAKDIQQATLGE
jgi:hypothetical protein